MGYKDIGAKEFLADNERFADLCNFYFFDGKPVIAPDDLVEQDTTELISVFGSGSVETQEQKWRDLLKRVVIKTSSIGSFVIIGVENQSDIHYAMPVRNMIYDAINYGKQIKEISKMHRKEGDLKSGSEFLSGFSKDDKLIPVITLTVYWGVEVWDAPRSLYEMILDTGLNLKSYLSDYRLNLLVPNEIDDFEKFRTSLGAVLEMIKLSKDEDRMNEAITTKAIYKNLEREAVKTIEMFTGIEFDVNEEDDKMDMCKAWVDHKQAGIIEGRTEGRAEGRAEEIVEMGYEFGLSKEDVLIKLQEKLHISATKAKEYLQEFGK